MNYKDFYQTANRKFLLNTVNAVKLINHNQIMYVEADDNYSKIFLDDHSEFLLSKTLGVVEEDLGNEMFFRCHRTYLVNAFFIKEICKGNDMCILLKNGLRIPLAKRRFGELRKLLNDKNRTTIYSKN